MEQFFFNIQMTGISVLIFVCIFLICRIITSKKPTLKVVKSKPTPKKKPPLKHKWNTRKLSQDPEPKPDKYRDYIEAAWSEIEK